MPSEEKTNHREEIEIEWIRENESPGRIKHLGNLDAREWIDHGQIKECLNEAPEECEANEEASMKNIWKLKTENEEIF